MAGWSGRPRSDITPGKWPSWAEEEPLERRSRVEREECGSSGEEPLEAAEMEDGTARGRPPSPGQQRRLLPWEEEELGRRPRSQEATGLWRSSGCSGTKSARWRRDAPTVTDWKNQTMRQRDAAAVKVLDLGPCLGTEREPQGHATEGKERPEAGKERALGVAGGATLRRDCDAIPPAQILHHPGNR